MSYNYSDYLKKKNTCCIPGPQGIRGVLGPTGITGQGFTGSTGSTGPIGSKTFIIEHPKDKSKFLVHACLEGPEVGVYYRGISEITNNHSVKIDLPLYIPDWATDFTTNITAIYDGKIKVYAVSEVDKNGFFNVYGENGKFNWVAIGKRDVINIEPCKTEINVKGFGPYKWVE
jgi:hypothetical protein